MGRSSLLGIERHSPKPPGHGSEALGPSETSDSGSDVQGLGAAADPAAPLDRGTPGIEDDARPAGAGVGADGADIAPDRIVGGPPDEAALDELREGGSAIDDGDERDDEDDDPVE